ncbi:glucosamine-6-phosphate deaminase 1 [Abditibacteriota bacterium]|nr:glucosamine-6-phosphate deaminase 1 [Abditibacteriota bacterium]
MNILVSPTKVELGQKAAHHAAHLLREALKQQDKANLIVATGASQFEMLDALVGEPEIDWSRVTIFHLDEYAGLSQDHPASFRRYLRERFIERLPIAPATFHAVNGEGDLEAECRRLGDLIADAPVDMACIGIGENGHLAFNDPPADFETEMPFLVVELDEVCRRQQLGEGWFPDLDAVPTRAISMSIRQILKSKTLVVSVPDKRKARAVKDAVKGKVTNCVPASILQTHPNTTLYLDAASASLLSV